MQSVSYHVRIPDEEFKEFATLSEAIQFASKHNAYPIIKEYRSTSKLDIQAAVQEAFDEFIPLNARDIVIEGEKGNLRTIEIFDIDDKSIKTLHEREMGEVFDELFWAIQCQLEYVGKNAYDNNVYSTSPLRLVRGIIEETE